MQKKIPTQRNLIPKWAAFAILAFVAACCAAPLTGCTDRTPTADEFVAAEKYCAQRGLKAVGLARPINGITNGIACETQDGRSWFEIPASALMVGAK